MCKQCALDDVFAASFLDETTGRVSYVSLGVCDGLPYISWVCDGNGTPCATPFAGKNPAHNLVVIPFAEAERLVTIEIKSKAINKRVRDKSGLSDWSHQGVILAGPFYNEVLERIETKIQLAAKAQAGQTEAIQTMPGPASILFAF